ncbi:MAG: hypothetical protein AMK69_22215 [Nitrospira bacterium SG8_3]|nr:MAG: hypothetical protein AMK69_22215 [Nitrospira bacterium SG8_3]
MKKNQKKVGKVFGLKEAIERYVRPQMKLHLAGGIGGPGAAICEIIRQYSGSAPGIELIQSTVTGHAINLIHANLVKKVIFSACIQISQTAHPSKVIQRAYANKKIELENWSLLSLQQRLMAGALGVGFMPTRSLIGSTLTSDNPQAFREMDDPFNRGETIGVLKALNPDLSIVHGCASDEFGNTILPVPYGDDIWGSLASTKGVVITAEKIVSSDVIRKYGSLVKIPGSVVKAVCLAPMGIHPFSFTSPIDDVESYETDNEFLEDLHQASSDNRKLDDWLNDWIFECPTQDHYLEKLGSQKISTLKTWAKRSPSLNKGLSETSTSDPVYGYTKDDMVVVAAAREIVHSVVKSNHKTMLVGAGTWSRSARLAYHRLIGKGYDIELITGNGQIGYIPQAGESSTQSVSGIKSANMLTDTITTHGVFVGGKNSQCLSILGAGQIDRYGNINSSRTYDGDFLVGTGGANDAANANEVILILNQSRKRFIETLPYITASGDKVTKVISTMGVYRKDPGKAELFLMGCLPDPEGTSLEEKIKEIESRCAWPLKSDQAIGYLPEPTKDELQLLRSIDY